MCRGVFQVKRNVELELEAVHALQKQGVPIQHGIEDSGASGDEVSTKPHSDSNGHDLQQSVVGFIGLQTSGEIPLSSSVTHGRCSALTSPDECLWYIQYLSCIVYADSKPLFKSRWGL